MWLLILILNVPGSQWQRAIHSYDSKALCESKGEELVLKIDPEKQTKNVSYKCRKLIFK